MSSALLPGSLCSRFKPTSRLISRKYGTVQDILEFTDIQLCVTWCSAQCRPVSML